MERGYQTHSLFTGMGVPPPEVTAAKKANLPRLKWRPSKKAGWATELLPERPGAFAASLAGQGSRPYTDEERQGVVWSGRPAKQAPRPTVIDVIHGVPKVDAPKYDEEAWVTTNMRQYTMGTTMKALTKDGLASK